MKALREQENRLDKWIDIWHKIEDNPNYVHAALKIMGPTWADCNRAIARFLERVIPDIESLEELKQSQDAFYEFHGELFKKHRTKIAIRATIGLHRTYEEKPTDIVIKTLQQDLYNLDSVFGGSWNAYSKRGRAINAKALLIENRCRKIYRRSLALRHTDELRYRIMVEWLALATICKIEAIRHCENLIRQTSEIQFDKQNSFLDFEWMTAATRNTFEEYIEKAFIGIITDLPIDEYEISNLHQIILERITRFPSKARKIPFDIADDIFHLKIDERGVVSL